MKLPRRKFLHLAVGAAALPAVSRIAMAQVYPMGIGIPETRRTGPWHEDRVAQIATRTRDRSALASRVMASRVAANAS